MTFPISELAEVATLNPRLNADLDSADLVSFVSMAGLSAEAGSVMNEQTRSYGQVAKGYTPFCNGDVLVAKITPCFENNKIGHAKLSRPFGFGSTEFHVVRARPGVTDPRYLLHYLRQDHVRDEGERKMTGSAGQRRIPLHFLSTLPLPLPPLAKQRRIAAILDEADILRAKRRLALKQFDELTQSIFVEMFGDLTQNTKKWPVVPVSNYVAMFQGGKSLEADGDDKTARHRVLKVSAVTSMTFKPLESKPLPDSYVPPSEHYVRRGDLLFSRANTTDLVGAVAFVTETPHNLVLPDKLWRFVWSEPSIADPIFVWALFQGQPIREEIGRRATGTSGSMKNISQSKLMTMPTILPPLSVQQEFARRLRSVQQVKGLSVEALEQADDLFASLQHRAFRGEL